MISFSSPKTGFGPRALKQQNNNNNKKQKANKQKNYGVEKELTSPQKVR